MADRGTTVHALRIEDSGLIAHAIEADLRLLGFTTFDFASTEAGAISAARRQCPVLITADHQLADGSGVNAVLEICAEQPTNPRRVHCRRQGRCRGASCSRCRVGKATIAQKV